MASITELEARKRKLERKHTVYMAHRSGDRSFLEAWQREWRDFVEDGDTQRELQEIEDEIVRAKKTKTKENGDEQS